MTAARSQLVSAIKQALDDMTQITDKDAANQQFAEKLATAVDNYVLALNITVSGVVTVGSQVTQTQTAPVKATIT